MGTQADLALQALGQQQNAPAAPARTQADIALAATSGAVPPAAAMRSAQSDDGWNLPVSGAPQLMPSAAIPRQSTDFIEASLHHPAKLIDGIGQLGENALAKIAGVLPDNSVSRAIIAKNAADNAQSAQWERDYQNRVGDTPGAYAGATLGEVAPFFLSGPARIVKGIGDAAEAAATRFLPQGAAKVGGRIAAGTATGAALGAVQPVTPLENLINTDVPGQNDYWMQKAEQTGLGALTGGTLSGATSAAGAVANKVGPELKAALFPQKYAAGQIANQLGDQTPTVVSSLKNAPTLVPGSVPTSAQAAGTPQLVMMEKALNNNNKEFANALLQRQNENNAARLAVVRDVAKTPAELDAAIKMREAITGPMRDFTVTNGNPVPVAGINGSLSSVANGPLGVIPTIGSAARSMQSELQGMTNVTPPNSLLNQPGSATASPAMLDALRQNTNDYLSKFAPNGAVGTKEQAAITPVKQSIINAIDAANPGHKLSTGGWGQGLEQAGPVAPGYRDYLSEFAKRSVPINTMGVGQELNDILSGKGLNSNLDPGLTLGNYTSALSRALKNSDYAIDPQAQKALEAVQSDLQRSTVSNSIRMGGSDTAFNQGAGKAFLRAMGAADGSSVPAALTGAATLAATGNAGAAVGAGMAVKNAGGLMANRVGKATGKLLLDPQLLAAELDAQAKAATVQPGGATLNNANRAALAAALLLQLRNDQRANVQPVQ